MVSAWWLLLAFVVGGYVGMLLMALLVVARDSDGDGKGERRQPRAADGPDLPKARPGDDWMI